MNQNLRPRSPKPVQFKIEANKCSLRVGDSVTPDTVVGTAVETGETVIAGCHGKVIGVHFSGGEHALIVTVHPKAQRS